MKIAHFADVHFRGLTRHEEYRNAFNDAFLSLRDEKPDVIYIGGDIVHSKTQGITPELIDLLTWWFTSLAEIAPVEVILGNHDGLIMNKDRQDAVSPIIAALNDDRIKLYKKSGIYDTPDENFVWCVFSPFDVAGWESITPVEGKINIAFYHGAVKGAKSDSGIDLEGEVTRELFEKFDFALLGDIHQRQYLNDAQTIAYCGSTIQQNYGEELDKGYLLWDIKSKTKFTTKFIKVKNDQPYITVDWSSNVSETLKLAQSFPTTGKIRYCIPSSVPENDIKSLYEQTQKIGNYSEIITKIATIDDSSHKVIQPLKSENLRDKTTLRSIVDEYLIAKKVPETQKSLALAGFEKYYDNVTIEDDVARNIVWSLKSLEFDNLFSYGSNNYIDFDKAPGITGIFGRNKSGKSSIIGTIAYALFNTSDRGSVKNLHIVNSDEDSCRAKIVMSVAEDEFEIERETNKVYSKRSETSATTKLSLKKRSTGDVLKDLNDEQRRETEKIVRRLIGTSDDFFYTCLAPQGQMNMFINEKSTSRKQILSRFLDLEIFDLYHERVKQDLAPLKASLKSSSSIDILSKNLNDLIEQKSRYQNELDDITSKLSNRREDLDKMKSPSLSEIVTDDDIKNVESKINRAEIEIDEIVKKIESLKSDVEDLNDKITKVDIAMSAASLEELKQQEADLKDLEMKYAINLKDLEAKNADINRLYKKIKILDDIPCGDKFPKCIFIKDAFEGKDLLKSEESTRDAIQRTIDILHDRIGELNKSDVKSKIEKLSKLGSLKSDLRQQVTKTESSIEIYSDRLTNKKALINTDQEKLKSLITRKNSQDTSGLEDQQRAYIALKQEITGYEKELVGISSNIGRSEEKISSLERQIKDLKEAINKQETLAILENAFSKKGIPQSIVSKNLPLINQEIGRILEGITGFTVEIECDDSNTIEIYLDYGDGKRIIELGSGMEKMIASIAIRVALTNISSLPKSDMLIIDEGFGALDETNLEACSRLLQNLKNYFKKIIIISHVDAIKDVVDNMITIETRGNRSRVNHV